MKDGEKNILIQGRRKLLPKLQQGCMLETIVVRRITRIIEHLKLEGNYKDHQVQLLAPHRTT